MTRIFTRLLLLTRPKPVPALGITQLTPIRACYRVAPLFTPTLIGRPTRTSFPTVPYGEARGDSRCGRHLVSTATTRTRLKAHAGYCAKGLRVLLAMTPSRGSLH